MSNTIDITDITDAELDAILGGTFNDDEVETDAGAEALARAAEHFGCRSVAAACRRAAPSRPVADVRRAARNASRYGRGFDYEGAIYARQDFGADTGDAN